ncbi:MAG: 50S ribosomal protein L11 methyltransferase [Robiginitalea sp.]|uniref:50S ribosomal protein L11 methyltransferase n=1 Tax=Robiginitalea sp. TaxID=1902411 RepID=UPI003C729C3B
MKYVRCILELQPLQPATDIFIAALSELGFESFEETERGLMAYIQEPQWDEAAFLGIPYLHHEAWEVNSRWEIVEPENWNAVWERDYKSIDVRGLCVVRAPFHPQPAGVKYDIVISPKMSFGTGHHQTTRLMLDYLLDLEVSGTSVLDVGTGTGVLAILCGLKGARHITGIDIDPWSVENAVENAERNGQNEMEVLEGSMDRVAGRQFDVVLANINRNALTELMAAISGVLREGGRLLISGFYQEDLPYLKDKAAEHGLVYGSFRVSDLWTAAYFEKQVLPS